MRYTIYKYQPSGFASGWTETQADTLPDGAVSVEVWDAKIADTGKVYVVDGGKK